jgi:hypothetical protein
MKRNSFLLALGLGAVAFAGITIAARVGASPAPSGDAPKPPKPCCFTNERFAGVCRVIPGADETCDFIQAYLNNPSSSGRTYCDSTTLRGGWQRVDCATGKPQETPPPTPPSSRRDARPRDGTAPSR